VTQQIILLFSIFFEQNLKLSFWKRQETAPGILRDQGKTKKTNNLKIKAKNNLNSFIVKFFLDPKKSP